jgi:hypothetical protein
MLLLAFCLPCLQLHSFWVPLARLAQTPIHWQFELRRPMLA